MKTMSRYQSLWQLERGSCSNVSATNTTNMNKNCLGKYIDTTSVCLVCSL